MALYNFALQLSSSFFSMVRFLTRQHIVPSLLFKGLVFSQWFGFSPGNTLFLHFFSRVWFFLNGSVSHQATHCSFTSFQGSGFFSMVRFLTRQHIVPSLLFKGLVFSQWFGFSPNNLIKTLITIIDILNFFENYPIM